MHSLQVEFLKSWLIANVLYETKLELTFEK